MSPQAATGHRKDRRVGRILRLAAGLCASIVALVLAFLVVEAAPALRTLGLSRFVTDARWLPGGGVEEGQFSLVPMAAASATVALGAALVATPLGILCAVFVVDLAPARVGASVRRLLEVMAGIPSVVYGFWGLVTLVPLVRELRGPGPSLVAGVLILTIMIVPTVAILSQAALLAVPRSYAEGAAALGLSRWTTLRSVTLPAAAPALGSAVLLATMRAIGETMAVLMVCGNVPQLSVDPFQPVRTLTANIALELGYATDAHRAVLFVSGLFLMGVVLVLVCLQGRLGRRGARVPAL